MTTKTTETKRDVTNARAHPYPTGTPTRLPGSFLCWESIAENNKLEPLDEKVGQEA